MIICRRCSRRHPDRTTFCSCGAYLEFDGEYVPDTAGPAGPTNVVVDPELRWSDGADAPDDDRAATTYVDARLPGAALPIDDAPQVVVDDASRPGDVACPRCRVPNAPGLRFCRHCGEELAAASAVVVELPRAAEERPSWWRRAVASLRRRSAQLDPSALAVTAQQMSAGGLSGETIAFRAGVGLLAGAGLLAVLGPWQPTLFSHARRALGSDHFVTIDRDHITAKTVNGSTPTVAHPDEGPENAIDGQANTAWATTWVESTATADEGAPGTCPSIGATDSALQLSFDKATDFDRIHILGGRTALDDTRQLYVRPRQLEIEIDGRCTPVTLDDTGELAVFDVAADEANSVTLRVVDVYPGEGSTVLEISEVAFQRRR